MEMNREFYQGTQSLLADIYRRYEVEDYSQQVEEMVSRLLIRSGQALELGAGVGLAAINLDARGWEVTALDFDPTVHEIAKENKAKYDSQVNFIQADFYQFQPTQQFDLVYYLDGFGIGEDADQIRLLRNIHDWLDDSGLAYIEVYQPNHWRLADGVSMRLTETIDRQYHFDEASQAMVDVWTDRNSGQTYTQRLKTYAPEAMKKLAQQAGLRAVAYYPNGRMDYQLMQYFDQASLEDCMSYAVILEKAN